MSDSKSDNKDVIAASESRPAQLASQPPRQRSMTAALALLLALASLAASAWLYYQLVYLKQQQNAEFSREISALLAQHEQRAVASEAALNRQRERISEIDSAWQQQLSVMQGQLSQLSEQVQSLSSVDRNDWLLAEAEYLLRMANQRLQLSGDSRAAAQLLASADAILRELDDPALYAVREALALELAALQGASSFDLEGLYLQLQGLAATAEALEVYQAPTYTPVAPPAEDASWEEGLKAGFARAWAKLRSYVRIRQHDEKFQAQLAPEHSAALRASLRMMLEQAQLALLSERPGLYGRSIDKAIAWLQRYYPLNDGRQALISSLSALRDTEIRVERPDISSSLRALKEYSKTRRWQREVGQ